ncbi:hypothetical protein Bca4012_096088 [Brassica carinata]
MANSFLLLANLKTDCCSTKTEVRFLIDVLGRQKSQKHGAEHDTEELESLNHRIELKRLCLMCEPIVKSEKLNESWLFPHMGDLLPEEFTLHVDYRSVIHFLFPKFRRTHLQDQ